MSKKDEFKLFAKAHPQLLTYLENNPNSSWQKLYEIYDIFGDDEDTWKSYLTPKSTTSTLADTIKNLDTKTIQEHINTAQKALSLIEGLTTKGAETITKGPISPRPLTKFFGD